jgi:1,4-dihydroxy-6-naphthoate synthase
VPGAPALEVTFADIDVTNGMAERGEFDVLKVSYAACRTCSTSTRCCPAGARWAGAAARWC